MVNLVNARFEPFEMRNLRGESVARPASVAFPQVFRLSFIVESRTMGGSFLTKQRWLLS